MTVKKVTFVVAIMAMTVGLRFFIGRENGLVGWPFILLLLGGGMLGYSHDAFIDRDEDE